MSLARLARNAQSKYKEREYDKCKRRALTALGCGCRLCESTLLKGAQHGRCQKTVQAAADVRYGVTLTWKWLPKLGLSGLRARAVCICPLGKTQARCRTPHTRRGSRGQTVTLQTYGQPVRPV